MTLKNKIIEALECTDFPNLKLLYSPESLELAPEILDELLDEEKTKFENKLLIPDSEISFETFEDVSVLDYYFGILEHYQSVHWDEVIRKIIEDFEPKYIDFGNQAAYSQRYYEMLKYCLEKCELDAEQRRIIQDGVEHFEVRGISLDNEKQEELKSISKKLSEIQQKFSNNVLDSKKEFEYLITNETIIADMPKDDILVAKKRAESAHKQWYLFDSSQGSYMSIMKYCSDSSVRRDFYEARQNVASNGKYNNKSIILEILALRERKAEILGFRSYAELSLKFKMAESPDQIIDLFSNISEKAKPKAQAELDEITEYFNIQELQNWDVTYYANKLREEKYDFDSKKLKEYFVFENVLSGMFETIYKLYNLEFKEINIDTYNEDVTVYEVYKDGIFLSYFFTDYFYNELKRPGAWANIMREKSLASKVLGIWKTPKKNYKKIVLNVCNFQKWADGVTLLTLWDVETMFHEFGHATHEILSKSEYSDLSWFHVEWDFVELPSQLLENWCRDRVWMKLFAKHKDTGEMVPDHMLDKLDQLETFWNGQLVLWQNTYAMMDMMLHSWNIPKTEQELDDFVNANYDANALLSRWEVYSPHTSFTHIFDGWYAAGYYSYMWAEIIEKEVWRAFKDSWDIFSPEVSKKFHDTILSAWTTKKASELFRDFFWRDVEIDAFLSEKWLLS